MIEDYTEFTYKYDCFKLYAHKREIILNGKSHKKLFNESYALNEMNFALNDYRHKLQSELDHDAEPEYYGDFTE